MGTSSTCEAVRRTVTTTRGSLAFHELGEGDVLLCIHGGAPGATGWGNFGGIADVLARRFRLLVVDLPGYGGSAPIDESEGRRPALAGQMAEFLALLDVPSAHVLGVGSGGSVAMEMALRWPELVDRLVLVGPAGSLAFSPSPTEGQKAIAGYYRGSGPSREKMREYLELTVFDKALITEDLVEERYQDSLLHQPTATVGSSAADDVPLWMRVHEIACPSLVVWGRDNRVQGYDNGILLLHRIPTVELHIFGGAGLSVHHEHPERFCGLVSSFLENA